jgi:hypothetical protein
LVDGFGKNFSDLPFDIVDDDKEFLAIVVGCFFDEYFDESLLVEVGLLVHLGELLLFLRLLFLLFMFHQDLFLDLDKGRVNFLVVH